MSHLDVLIVDPDPDLAGFLRDVLHAEGIHVRIAQDGPSGVQAVRKQLPNVLFATIDSEWEAGTRNLIETVRSMDPERRVPIVLLTDPHNGGTPDSVPKDCLRLEKKNPETLSREILVLVKNRIGPDSPPPSHAPNGMDAPPQQGGVPWAVIENLDEAIVKVDPHLRILNLNKAAGRLLGSLQRGAVRSLDDLFAPSSRDEIRKALDGAAPLPNESLSAVTADGKIYNLYALQAGEGEPNADRSWFLMIRKASEELEAGGALTRKDEELILLREILKHARSSLPEEAIFPFLLEKSIEITDADAGTVALLDVEDGEQGHLAFRYAIGDQSETIRGIYIPRGHGIIGWCVSNDEPVIVNNVNEDERFFPWVDQMSGFHTRSILCMPIRSDGKVFGALELINKHKGEFTRKDLERLQILVEAATFNMKTALAQRRIISQRDYYSGIMDSLSEGVMIMGRDRRVLDVNQFFMMFLNRERHEIIGQTCHRLLWNSETPCKDCFLDRFRIFEEGCDFSTTIEMPNQEGETARFRISGTPLEVQDEIISSCILTFHDVTRVHHLHDYLQASSSVASILLKGQDVRGLVSETLEIMGRAARASRCYWFENHKDDQGDVHMILQAEWCSSEIQPLLEDPSARRCRYADGFSRWHEAFSKGRIVAGSVDEFPSEERDLLKQRSIRSILLIPLTVQETFEGFIGFDNCSRSQPWQEAEINLLQTTANFLSKAFEHARSLEALRESEAQYRDIYENIYDSWYLHDMDGRFLEVNPAVERSAGYSREELLQMRLQDLIPRRYRDRFSRYLRNIREKGIAEGLVRIRTKEGEERVMEYRNWLVQRPDGTQASRGLVRDVTERVNLRSQLKHAQRMESIGTIATGISHNFRNLLAGIMTNCQLIHMKYRHIPELERFSGEILKLTRAGSELINNLLQFSRKGSPETKTVINLSDVLEETVNIISGSFDKRIEIRTKWPEVLPVYADASSLSQVFMNLCTNARDAMPNGGTLELTAGQQGDHISVRIQDTGVGMDKAILGKVYDPFFTTKPPGRGTGLGLSTAYGIVKQHGGGILIESEVNRGTTFEVNLPVPDTTTRGEERVTTPLVPGKGQKVLVVDDDDTILQPIIELLEGLGYQASAASNGLQAIEAHRTWKPDVILLDRSMPGMDGLETADKILKADPDAWIILISGYDEHGPDGIDSRVRESIKAYIPKPFDIGEVSKVLAEVLSP